MIYLIQSSVLENFPVSASKMPMVQIRTDRKRIKKMYMNDWTKKEEMMRDFDISYDALNETRILLASYTYVDYSGSAFVLFIRNGKLYEVNGGHCSCNGLEGQWEPEETTKEALFRRMEKGYLGYDEGNIFADELKSVLEEF
jgi:hypothetical protein